MCLTESGVVHGSFRGNSLVMLTNSGGDPCGARTHSAYSVVFSYCKRYCMCLMPLCL